VALRTEEDLENKGLWRSKVRIFNLGDKCWRNISCPPICGDGVHLNGTVNWLTVRDDLQSFFVGGTLNAFIPFVELSVIASLDLSTETYTQFLLPSSVNEVPCVVPSLQVLMDCLSFLHDFKKTEFVIWQMKEFGVQESWTRLFRIEYVNLQMHNLPYMKKASLLPLYSSKNGESLILLINDDEDQRVIIYNQRDKKVERIKITNERYWSSSIYYVESLVSTPWK
jgi:F-box interacting protein